MGQCGSVGMIEPRYDGSLVECVKGHPRLQENCLGTSWHVLPACAPRSEPQKTPTSRSIGRPGCDRSAGPESGLSVGFSPISTCLYHLHVGVTWLVSAPTTIRDTPVFYRSRSGCFWDRVGRFFTDAFGFGLLQASRPLLISLPLTRGRASDRHRSDMEHGQGDRNRSFGSRRRHGTVVSDVMVYVFQMSSVSES